MGSEAAVCVLFFLSIFQLYARVCVECRLTNKYKYGGSI